MVLRTVIIFRWRILSGAETRLKRGDRRDGDNELGEDKTLRASV